MRYQQVARGLRAMLFAIAVSFGACTQPQPGPVPSGQTSQLTDFASGVDAAFSVETFALSATPTLTLVTPTAMKAFSLSGPGGSCPAFPLTFQVTNYVLGAGKGSVSCRVDAGAPVTSVTSPITIPTMTKGMHYVTCTLAAANGDLVADATARFVTAYQCTQDPFDPNFICTTASQCDDGNACSLDACTNNKCIYAMVPYCCTSAWQCATNVETCLNPNTVNAKCSTCQADSECDDFSKCTIDKCDLTGPKGLCKNTKPDPECCENATDLCDDGKPCTIDSCVTAVAPATLGKCQHILPPGACCDASECDDGDVCTADVCQDLLCRHGSNSLRPDCCSATTNPNCDDTNICTTDSCTVKQTGWMQCSHVIDDVNKNCCDAPKTNCDDGQPCTTDNCIAHQCVYTPSASCCMHTGATGIAECNDNNVCTNEYCDLSSFPGKCVWSTVAECCNGAGDCNDNKYCTWDVCDTVQHKCTHDKPDPYCCDEAYECDDGKYCTADTCINHSCVSGPNSLFGTCCEANADCNDGSVCTIDTCDTWNHKCIFVGNGDPNCCMTPYDCDDSNCATMNLCSASNQCVFKPQPGLCSVDIDCDDNDVCTTDSCDTSGDCGVCKHTTSNSCCHADYECDDSKGASPNPKAACTKDLCVNAACVHLDAKNCCLNDTDALTACDDKNGCTIDYCLNNQCRHTTPKNGCCASNYDCNDGDKCTTDACPAPVGGASTSTCTHTTIAGCSCTYQGAINGVECNDNNACTADACTASKCTHTAITGCCLDKFDCNDSNACTFDVCLANECTNFFTDNGKKLCCTPETEATDCAYLNTQCSTGKCMVLTGGVTECQAVAMPVCTVNVGYCQDFSGGATPKAVGWNPTDVPYVAPVDGVTTPATLWSIGTDGNLGPDAHAAMTWSPITYGGYETCLQSPIIQAAGASTITLQYDHELSVFDPDMTTISVLGILQDQSKLTQEVDWSTATVIDSVTPHATIGPQTVDVKLPAALSSSNGLRLAFCVAGDKTSSMHGFALDNVCIVKGSKPTFGKYDGANWVESCPVNQIVGYNTTKTIPLKARDPDADAILSFSIVEGPEFVKLTSALYYWLDTSWNSTLTIKPTLLSHLGTHKVTVKVSDGSLYSTCSFEITVTYQGGYLVWRPNGVDPTYGEAIANALKAKYAAAGVQNINDLALYSDLTKFLAIFVVLGNYPHNHPLTTEESDLLAMYLANKGHLYMEGGETWSHDLTAANNLFQIQAVADISPNGINGPLSGGGFYHDITVTPTKDYQFSFAKNDVAINNDIDPLSAKDTHRTKAVLKSDDTAEAVWVQVAHDSDAGYRTVGSSIPFAGVQTGLNTPAEMLDRIMYFFTNGFIDCLSASQCNDNDDCTADSCIKGECVHDNTCACAGIAGAPCGGSATIVSNGPGSTNSVKNYGCDPTHVYGGSETAFSFTAPSSKPVSVTVNGLTNPQARLFVLHASKLECNPKQCIAMGTTTLNFAAAAGQQYYVVIDTPAGQTAQANLSFDCGAGEICNDTIDNNGNGLVDCNDLASCCGDPACGEVCNDKDDDCDGQTDEGCNVDGDPYCAVAMTTIGKPKTCPQGGGDCNDNNSVINPGVQEICANAKDDNCNGTQDEENAFGCKVYYTDLDNDGFGTGLGNCLCTPAGVIKASKNGDCDDAAILVNPAALEICDNGIDDNCANGQNDLNAQQCKDFYTDIDGDTWGVLPKKCMCFGDGANTATKFYDCNDTDNAVSQDSIELCNDIDDNCNGSTDEGCDDDKDGYCDATMGCLYIGGTAKMCGTGLQDQNVAVNCPAGKKVTSVDFVSFGNATGPCNGFVKGTCDAAGALAKVQAACVGNASCSFKADAATFGEPCAGTAKNLRIQVTCTGVGGNPPVACLSGCGDSDDLNPDINPAGLEICDGKDNNSNGKTDEGCDDDGDGYCDTSVATGMIVIPGAPICVHGLTDCDDTNAQVNAGMQETCATPLIDDNCSGSVNDINALECAPFFVDGDSDGYGTKDFLCLCKPDGSYKAKKTNDCNDNDPFMNPGMKETCDNFDNNCNTQIDEGCDKDGDHYCDAAYQLKPNTSIDVCINGGGDCNDDAITGHNVNPGVNEICDNGIDDNCDGSENSLNATLCKTFYVDADGDTFGAAASQCWCAPKDSYSATNSDDCNDAAKGVHPGVTEACDGIDNNCDGVTDEGCDDDGDGYCDAAIVFVNNWACAHGAGDCNDEAVLIHPTAVEKCDDIDNNCNSKTDENCDKDGDHYCDKALIVSTNPFPKVCTEGPGDCNDYNVDQNPGAQEVCSNNIDDNCNDSQNDEGALNCKNFYYDHDADGVGTNNAKCLCTLPVGSYFSAAKGGDCDDNDAEIYPGNKEKCFDGKDNNCNLNDNDVDANGCTVFYFDNDQDGYGLSGIHECVCVVEGKYTAIQGGDCNDTAATVAPNKPEVCDDIDNNCDNFVDENCDVDHDGYCGAGKTVISLPNSCPYGGGDCNDSDNKVNPGKPELCNGFDDNCAGAPAIDEGCDDDGDSYCDAGMTVEAGANCTSGDCNDDNGAINPGKDELCSTLYDDNCNGDTNDLGGPDCKNFGVDLDGDTYSDSSIDPKCMCHAAGVYTGTHDNDCNDKSNLVNPGMPEICDNVDNNCDGVTDESCDKDGDGYCDAAKVTIGKPAVCIHGGNDCNDDATSGHDINPGVKEVCGNNIDENCDTDLDGLNATNCTVYYLDNDGDQWAVNLAQCWCAPNGKYNVSDEAKVGDCDDAEHDVNPGMQETCATAYDDNCNGTANDIGATQCTSFFPDADKDGFGAGDGHCQCFPQGIYHTLIGGDCDDSNAMANPAQAEVCDGADNNCHGDVDEGCDDDSDGYCDAGMVLIGTPSVCPHGGKDCNDGVSAVHPGKFKETCDDVDDDCDGATDNGCDDDKDGYCDANLDLVTPWPAVCSQHGGNDCDDSSAAIHPDKSEICDNLDNNCDKQIDEGCDKDNDDYCDSNIGIVGVPLTCQSGGGDCNDGNVAIHPNAEDVCDGIDNNCANGVDEFCKDADLDGYCIGVQPQSLQCPNGGGDCDDSNINVHPNAPELCSTAIDDNCDGIINAVNNSDCKNWYLDEDGDGYGTGDPTCRCYPIGNVNALASGDCDDINAAIKPGATEVCDGIDNNCAEIDLIYADEGCDNDSDGYCDASMLMTSTAKCNKSTLPTAGAIIPGDDCNDEVATTHPALEETLCNNVDDNCNTVVDEGCDDDNDNYCDVSMIVVGAVGTVSTCTASGGASDDYGNDCNDTDGLVNPGVKENCGTAYDDNCDGQLDAINATGCQNFYYDGDLDSYGNPTLYLCQCGPDAPTKYTSLIGNDCDDSNAGINASVTQEICDGYDNNCNSSTDEGCDDDHDGHCDAGMTTTSNWACPATVVKDSDCSTPVDPPVYLGPFTMNTFGAGGGFHSYYKEFWYANGSTVSRYTKAYAPISTFSAGDLVINQIWGEPASEQWYEADQAGFVSKREGTANTEIWKTAIGAPVSGVTADALYVYAMSSDASAGWKVWQINKTSGAIVSWFVLNAGGVAEPVNPKIALVDGIFYVTTSSNVVYRFNFSTQTYINGFTTAGDKINSFAFNGTDLCTGGQTASVHCYLIVNICKNGDDCDDFDMTVHPGIDDICDDKDNNCDAYTDELCDKDDDGFCDSALTTVGTPLTCQSGGGDCNDDAITGPTIHPFATEVCDGIDENCDGIDDNPGADGCQEFHYDGDQDGHGVASTQCLCAKDGFFSAKNSDDCDDTCPSCYPGATEICDGKDNNCTLGADEGCNMDGDQYCSTLVATIGTPDVCPGGGGDCNDADGNIYPGAPEWCDNNDQNCNGVVDETCDDDDDDYCDIQNKAVGALGTIATCKKTAGSADASGTTMGDDCDDTMAGVHPNVTEDCSTSYDDNCDAALDGLDTLNCTKFYYDEDQDGYGEGIPAGGVLSQFDDKAVCTCVSGFVPKYNTTVRGEDLSSCTDNNAEINPGATETCLTLNVDDDCNGEWNEQDKAGCTPYYADADGDGFGDPSTPPQCWCAPYGVFSVVGNATDCNDNNAYINGAVTKETCNNLDDNCNGITDEGCDDDDDGYCDANYAKIAVSIDVCANTPAAALVGDDCYDGATDCVVATNYNTCFTNAKLDAVAVATHPSGSETCDNIDNNCAGSTTSVDQAQADASTTLPLLSGSTVIHYMQEVTPAVSGRLASVQIPMQWSIGGSATLALYSSIPTGTGTGGTLVATASAGLSHLASFAPITFLFDKAPGSAAYLPTVTAGAKYWLVLASTNAGAVQASGTAYAGGALYSALSGGSFAAISGSLTFSTTISNGVGVDEGCDDDGDDYCDKNMTVVGALGSVSVCPLSSPGTGDDCNDTAVTGTPIHPGVAESCDNVDNNCTAGTDEDCDVDGDDYCNAFMVTTSSTACPHGGGDCDDRDVNVYPSAAEVCDNLDNNCAEYPSLSTLADQSQTVQVGNAPADAFVPAGAAVMQQIKIAKGGSLQAVRVALKGTATVTMKVYGQGTSAPTTPAAGNGALLSTTTASVASTGYTWVTFAFGGSTASPVLPASTTGNLNYIVLSSSSDFSVGFNTGASAYSDGLYYTATASAQPFIVKSGDTMFQTFVAGATSAGGALLVDEGCNADGDAYCNAFMTTLGAPKVCASGGGDCNDNNADIKPGAPEVCDNADNNCDAFSYTLSLNQSVSTLSTPLAVGAYIQQEIKPLSTNLLQAVRIPIQWTGATPSTVSLAVYSASPSSPTLANATLLSTSTASFPGSSADFVPTWFYFNGSPGSAPMLPAATSSSAKLYLVLSVTGNAVNIGSVGDATTYGNGAFYTWSGTAWTVGNVDLSFRAYTNGGAGVDEGCDDDNDDFCDAAMTIAANAGTIKTCKSTRVSSGSGDDCNDDVALLSGIPCDGDAACLANAALVNPGVDEKCDDLDNNCAAGTDEDCDVDNDGYCNAYMVTNGTPSTCLGGGLDCDDQDVNVAPAGVEEVCDNIDNNCQTFPALSTLSDQKQLVFAAAQPAQATIAANAFAMQEIRAGKTGKLQAVRVMLQGPATVTMSVYTTQPATPSLTPLSTTTAVVASSGAASDYTKVTFNFDGANATSPLPPVTTGNNYYIVLSSSSPFKVGANVTSTAGGAYANGRYFVANTSTSNFVETPVVPPATSYVDMVFETFIGQTSGTQVVDEGCDDDGDKYCDANMTVVGAKGTVAICTLSSPGAGDDCNDDVDPLTGDPCASTPCFTAAGKIHPNAEEVCDNIDNNCTGSPAVDEGCDDDNDDYCDITMWAIGGMGAIDTCKKTPGSLDGTATVKGNDCNDTNDFVGGSTNPGKDEICNNMDDNCDDHTDETCDDDGDGYCDYNVKVDIPATLSVLPVCSNTLASGPHGDDCNDNKFIKTGLDCNGDQTCLDAAKTIHPKVTEKCDNIDNNCDAVTDETCDDDGDGYCDSKVDKSSGVIAACPLTGTAAGKGDDCNDGLDTTLLTECTGATQAACLLIAKAIHPGLVTTENCSTAYDDNCDGLTNTIDSIGCSYYLDVDADGFGSGATGHCYCAATDKYTATDVAGFTPNNTDCNDYDATVKPGGEEICDGVDNQCPLAGVAFVASVDEGCDDDGDGYCDAAMKKKTGMSIPCTLSPQAASVGDDCNDDKAVGTGASCAGDTGCLAAAFLIHPGAEEICDGVANACTGIIDDGCDGDGDGWCNSGKKLTSSALCTADVAWQHPGDGVVVNGLDCDDSCSSCHLGQVESDTVADCDGRDNDCDGATDEMCKAVSVDASFACAYGVTTSGSSGGQGFAYPVKLQVELGGTSPYGSATANATSIAGWQAAVPYTLKSSLFPWLQALFP